MSLVSFCRTEEVPAGSALCRLAGGKRLAVAQQTDSESGYVAFEQNCPHADGPLGQGKLHGDVIVCPWHFFRFSLKTGEAVGTTGSIMKLRLFPVVVRNGEILVDI